MANKIYAAIVACVLAGCQSGSVAPFAEDAPTEVKKKRTTALINAFKPKVKDVAFITPVSDFKVTTYRKGLLRAQKEDKTLWELELPGFAFAEPVTDGKALYVHTTDGSVWAIDLKGKVLWGVERTSGSLIHDQGLSPVLFENKVYVGFSSGRVLALEKDSGRVLWEGLAGKQGNNEQKLNDIVHLKVNRDKAVVVTASGNVVAFNTEGGQKAWEQNFVGIAKLTQTDESFVLTLPDEVLKLDASDGSIEWRHTGEKFTTAAVVAGEYLAVGAQSGYVLFLKPENGQLHFQKKLGKDIAQLELNQNALLAMDRKGHIETFNLA